MEACGLDVVARVLCPCVSLRTLYTKLAAVPKSLDMNSLRTNRYLRGNQSKFYHISLSLCALTSVFPGIGYTTGWGQLLFYVYHHLNNDIGYSSHPFLFFCSDDAVFYLYRRLLHDAAAKHFSLCTFVDLQLLLYQARAWIGDLSLQVDAFQLSDIAILTVSSTYMGDVLPPPPSPAREWCYGPSHKKSHSRPLQPLALDVNI
ncbi:hypothetical protein F4859DRAFT_51371 [Xylaria cf. heliscus]|nr:hypothetical protein F4859DRAFT_51371 [Xylaria cf. heliscus]